MSLTIPSKDFSNWNNLFPDPYLRDYAQTGLIDASATTSPQPNTGNSIIDALENPFETYRFKRNTPTGPLQRGDKIDSMGLKPGDKFYCSMVIDIPTTSASISLLTAMVWFPIGSSTAQLFTPAVNGPGFVSGGVQIVNFGLITIPPTCGGISVRTFHTGGTATINESILAVGFYRNLFTITDSTLLAARTLQAGNRLLSELGMQDIKRQIVLPRNLYTLLGTTSVIEEINLYYPNFITKRSSDVIDVRANFGRQMDYGYRLQAGNTTQPQYNISSGIVPVTVSLLGQGTLKNIGSALSNLNIVDKTKTTAIDVMTMLDSKTQAQTYQTQIVSVLPGTVKMVGPKTNTGTGGTAIAHYGQGGRSLQNLFSQIMLPAGNPASIAESLLLYPTAVSGANYLGSTNMWLNVVNNTATGQDTGFNKIAAGWGTPGTNDKFNSTGYPVTPVTGNVMFDVIKAAGAQLVYYNGTAWGTMPTTFCTSVGNVAVASTSTFQKVTGSFLTDGCFVGGIVYMQGFNNAVNNGKFTVTAVTSTTLTVSATNLIAEAATGTKGYTAFVMSFSKFFITYASAYSTSGSFKAPDFLVLYTATNDFFLANGVDTNGLYAAFIANMNLFIASLRAYSTTMKLIIGTPDPGVNQDGFGIFQGAKGTFHQFRQNMIDTASRLIAQFDTAAYNAANTYIVSAGTNVNPLTGYDFTTENMDKFSTVQRTIPTDYVHPGVIGYKQLGDTFAAIIQFLRP